MKNKNTVSHKLILSDILISLSIISDVFRFSKLSKYPLLSVFSLTVINPGESEKSVLENASLSAESNGANSIPLIHFHSDTRPINNHVNYICTWALHQYLTNPFLLSAKARTGNNVFWAYSSKIQHLYDGIDFRSWSYSTFKVDRRFLITADL